MKQTCLLVLLTLIGYSATAQITAIPDPAFEQELIDQNIDSDGVLNGQVLTSDVENLSDLNIEVNYELDNITGIESFISLENLTINFTELTTLDLSQNIKLKTVNCMNNLITSITLPSSTFLEEVYLGNVSDLGPWNEIVEIDLSNNPNIKIIGADMLPTLDIINLKNGNNNPDMNIDIRMWGGDGPADPNATNNTVCIQVDDEALAQNSQLPYSEWIIYNPEAAFLFSENCALGTQSFVSNISISIYPNPTSDMLYFSTANGTAVEKVVLFDISGRIVKEFSTVSNSQISAAGLAKGVYVIQMFSGNAVQTAKVVVE